MLLGDRFGQWRYLGCMRASATGKQAYMGCECGIKRWVSVYALERSKHPSASCGCVQRKTRYELAESRRAARAKGEAWKRPFQTEH